MDLLCCETETVTKLYDDPTLIEDDRVFRNMLLSEDRYTLTSCYFKCFQTDLRPFMRRIVADWMLEVCEEERCQEEVFPLAANAMDRFLALVRVRKTQLQLLGAVCLFIASKLRQSKPLSSERLCLYTDHSITVAELIDWELLVLSRLKWDLAAITPYEFVGPILRRLPLANKQDLIKRHAHTFIGLCSTDVKFSMYPSSMIAAASIGAAILGLTARLDKQWSSMEVMQMLHDITGVEADCLRACLEQIEETVCNRLAAAPVQSMAVPLGGMPSHKLEEQQRDPTEMMEQAGTPTDVQDVLF